jgi:parallel beta-helix repeat protein
MFTLAFNIQPVKAEPGTIIVPDDYPTIQEAINNANEGDTIFVRNGTYYEHVVVNKTVSLIGENKFNTLIDGNGTGNVVTIKADGVAITGFTIENSDIICNATAGYGIDVGYVNGIWYGACNWLISRNIIVNNGIGIRCHRFHKNGTISENIIKNNRLDGVILGRPSIYCCILNNAFINNDILLCEGLNCSIIGNSISNSDYGILMSGCDHCELFHNNFINNTSQLVIAPEYGPSIYDNGYPSGGNYWSDYTGVDLYSGPFQNETGSEGIGDTPYVIDGNNQDNYPLMKPYDGPHDIGITSAITSKTIVGQGYSLYIDIKIINYGTHDEIFNVTIYANTTIIATFTNITLSSGNSATVTFTWNTTGFAKGNDTIEAYASPVQNETDVTDNRRTDGWVVVTWLGDLTDKDHLTPPDGVPDGKVDENDLWYFCSAFIDYYKIPRLETNCDFDNNHKIDEDDLWTFCSAFKDYYKTH